MGHAAKSQKVLATLQAKPDLTFTDVARALVGAADDGAVTHVQALNLVAKMPADPVGLRSFLSYLQQAATHTQGMIATEKHRRTAGAGF